MNRKVKFCAAGLMFGLVEFKSRFLRKKVRGGANPNLFLNILSS